MHKKFDNVASRTSQLSCYPCGYEDRILLFDVGINSLFQIILLKFLANVSWFFRSQ